METLIKKIGKRSEEGFLRSCTLLFLFIVLLSMDTMAQGENGASTENDLARKELLGYIYMVVGFAVVIGIAWFTTSRAKKQRENGNEKNHHHHYIKHPHLYNRRHHHHPVFRK